MAQRKADQMEKLRSALGVSSTGNEGDAFNRELQVGDSTTNVGMDMQAKASCASPQTHLRAPNPLLGVPLRCPTASFPTAVFSSRGEVGHQHQSEVSGRHQTQLVTAASETQCP